MAGLPFNLIPIKEDEEETLTPEVTPMGTDRLPFRLIPIEEETTEIPSTGDTTGVVESPRLPFKLIPTEDTTVDTPTGGNLQDAPQQKIKVVDKLTEGGLFGDNPDRSIEEYIQEKYPEGYAPSDIQKDETLRDTRDVFLRSRYGVDVDNWDDDEKQQSFLNTIRLFQSGNSPKTIREVAYIYETDSEGRDAYRKGMVLFENLSGTFSDNYTWGETADSVWDYARGAILDPVNLLGGLIGRSASSIGTKAAAAQAIAMAKREATKGVASRTFKEAFKQMAVKPLQKGALTEIGVAGAVDALAAVGSDYAYQSGMIGIDYQEDYSKVQLGLAALGGLVGAGIQGGFIVARDLRGGVIKLPEPRSLENTEDIFVLVNSVVEDLQKVAFKSPPINTDWATKVGSGNEIRGFDTSFWKSFMLGDSELGHKGFAYTLLESGFRWSKRDADDKVTNWVADAMKSFDDAQAKTFIKAFEGAYGVKLKGLGGPRATMEQLGNDLARKMSDGGTANSIMSQTARILGLRVPDMTAEQFAAMASKEVGILDTNMSYLDKVFGKAGVLLGRNVEYAQGKYIELLVSHPATSTLNAVGWASKSTMESASQMLQMAFIHAPLGAFKRATGDAAGATAQWNKVRTLAVSNARKVGNLLDPYTTYDNFIELTQSNPEMFKEILYTMAGGVTTSRGPNLTKAQAKALGMTEEMLKDPKWYTKVDNVTEVIKNISLVKSVDVLSKSQELMFRMDQNLMDTFGMSYREFVDNPNFNQLIASPKYQGVVAKSVAQVEETIFSKSFKYVDNRAIRDVATIIEDFRKLPGIGVMVPFGRFFNNTIATMSEYSGATIMMKPFIGPSANNKGYLELATKAAAGWSLVYSMVDLEKEYIKEGVPVDQHRGMEGSLIDDSANFPFIAAKIMSRVIAYEELSKEDPKWQAPTEELKRMVELLGGGLLRNVESSGDSLITAAQMVLSGEIDQAMLEGWNVFQNITSTAASGVTRFAEPYNTLWSYFGGPENSTLPPLDSKQGRSTIIKSLRYTDQFYRSLLGTDLGSEPRQSATNDFISRSPDRMVGFKSTPPQTAARKVLAMAGLPEWNVGIFSDVPEATNFVNEVLRPTLEANAEVLLQNPDFIDAPTAVRTEAVKKMITESRRQAMEYIRRAGDTKNQRINIILEIDKLASVSTIEDIIKNDIDEGLEYEDLTYEQLQTLKMYIESMEDYDKKKYGLDF